MTHVWTHCTDRERIALCGYVDGIGRVGVARFTPTPRPLTRGEAVAQGIDCPACMARLPADSPTVRPSLLARLWAWLTGGQRAES